MQFGQYYLGDITDIFQFSCITRKNCETNHVPEE